MYDDIVVKLPVLILYGSEENWEDEEKERMLGDQDAFGYKKEEAAEELIKNDDVVIECLDTEESEESKLKKNIVKNNLLMIIFRNS